MPATPATTPSLLPSARTWLLAIAAPAEAKAALRALDAPIGLADQPWILHTISDTIDLIVTGIGKSNAAGAVGRHADPRRHRAVVSVGVAGALPGSGLGLCQAVAATASTYADEGLTTPEGFMDCHAMGFPLGDFPGSAVPNDPAVHLALRQLAGATGVVATVSTCSGLDALAELVRARTGAVAEAMEGAAAGQVAHRLGIPFGELRVISNTTGDRSKQVWNLEGALLQLSAVIGLLGERLSAPPR